MRLRQWRRPLVAMVLGWVLCTATNAQEAAEAGPDFTARKENASPLSQQVEDLKQVLH